jgi:uncharacterized protein (TIGR03435 family)
MSYLFCRTAPQRRCAVVPLAVITIFASWFALAPAVSAQAQTASATLPPATDGTASAATFELADIHPSPHRNEFVADGVIRGDRYDLRSATMLYMISTAYGMPQSNIVGGPPWLGNDRFDIAAKVPQAAPREAINNMLKALLADRFKLVVHPDTRPMPAFVLTAGKGGKPKMKQSDGTGDSSCHIVEQPPAPTGTFPLRVIDCQNVTMGTFAADISGMAGGYFENPVVDLTRLKGTWDFEIRFSGRGMVALSGADGISLFDAVDKQLGLKLEQQKVPTAVLVVDSVNEKPTDNPPGVAAALPPPLPAEFEVAVIKPSGPDEQLGGAVEPGGEVHATAMPLRMMIQIAWDVEGDDQMLVGPKFMDTEKFDLLAKVYADPPSIGGSQEINPDDARIMLKALLVERFKIASHMENRPVNGYALASANPRLQKADPSERSECKEGPGADGKDPRIANPARSRLVTCTNTTMEQFATKVRALAGGYFQGESVVDQTNLPGAYDFTFNFSTARAAGFGRGVGGGTSTSPDDPTGAISIFDALSKQLGLKLEEKKISLPVLVIDHIEEKPTEN